MTDTNFNILPKSFYKTENGKQELVVDKKLADAVQAGIQARLNELPPAEQQVFLAMTSNLAPGSVDSKQQPDDVLNAYEPAARRIVTDSDVTAYVGDIADFIARAMIKSQNKQRESALAGRFAAHQAAKADLDSQADQSMKAADKLKSGAIATVVTSVVGGVVGIAGSGTSAIGSLKQVGSMTSSMNATKGVTSKITQEQQHIDNLTKTIPMLQDGGAKASAAAQISKGQSTIAGLTDTQNVGKQTFEKAQSLSQVFTSLGQVGSTSDDIARGTGSSTDSQLQADSKRADAQGSRDAAAAQFEQQIADAQKTLEDQLKQMCEQIIAFIKNAQDAKLQAMAAVTRA